MIHKYKDKGHLIRKLLPVRSLSVCWSVILPIVCYKVCTVGRLSIRPAGEWQSYAKEGKVLEIGSQW